MTKLRICLVSSEVAPFAKTGGLADVASGLPRDLARRGHDVRVVMPFYGAIQKAGWETEPVPQMRQVRMEFGERAFEISAAVARLPNSKVPVFFIDCPELFGGDDIYTETDEHLRFAVLSRASIELCQRMQWGPDVFHCNDWHAALLPLYLQARYAWDELFAATKTVLTIHNIGYQGIFSNEVLREVLLDGQRHLLPEDDESNGRINFLKVGVVYADALTTVSRTYAREIQTSEYGMGLESVLSQHRAKLVGIVNGVDYGDWDPATDALIPSNYSLRDLAGKAACKAQLLSRFGLNGGERVPVIGVVARLSYQKGFQLLPQVLPALLEHVDARLLVLGSGEDQYEQFFQKLRDQYPSKVGFFRGYNNELAHQIEAGADIFLMPSLYEPCGLNQMYSLRYGTVPVVRKTGGLADTVDDYDIASGRGTGFLFEAFEAAALSRALRRALEVFGDSARWRALMLQGMTRDFSWEQQGRHYVALYERMLNR